MRREFRTLLNLAPCSCKPRASLQHPHVRRGIARGKVEIDLIRRGRHATGSTS